MYVHIITGNYKNACIYYRQTYGPLCTASSPYLIQYQHLTVVNFGYVFLNQVQESTRGGHNHMDSLVQPHDVVTETGTTCGHHDASL